MKTIMDSSVYRRLVVGPGKIKSEIKKINIEDDYIDKSFITEQVMILKRRGLYPNKGIIIDLIDNGTFLPIVNDALKLPSYFNYIEISNGRDVKILIDMTKEYRSGNMSRNAFFGMMNNALVRYELAVNGNAFVHSSEFCRQHSIAYSRMNSKILDKLYAINMDDIKSDLISFVFAKFFLVNMAEKTINSDVDNLAHKSCFNDTSISIIKEYEEGFGVSEKELYGNVFNLFDSLSKIKGMKDLDFRLFLSNYVKMFGETSLLAIDDLGSFMQTIYGAALGSGLNNKEIVIENTLGKTLDSAQKSFIRLVRLK